MPTRTRIAAVCLSVLCHVGLGADTVRIVQDRQPRARVVVPDACSGQTQETAALLVRYVKLSSGAVLPIAKESEAGAAQMPVQIHVGRTAYVKGLALGIDKLDDDGFVIKGPDDTHLVIVGPTDYATEFGVYEFLERYMGVRWLMPGDDGDDVPEHATIDVPNAEVRQEPAFFSRLFSGLRGGAQITWARRNRMHGRVSFHHHLIQLFPPQTYTKTHPHFFPIIKSRKRGAGHQDDGRFLPPTNSTHGWQPCFTADGIVDEAVKNICRYFDENPDVPSYSLGVNDSSGHCECAKCQAKDPGGDNFLGRRDVSDRYFEWCNKVVERVLEKHPDKFFGCLAYSEIAQPPSRIKVHPRIIPYMTYDRMKWVDPELRSQGEEMTKQWQQMCPTVGWYDYIYGSAYCVPRVWFHHMGEYYRFGHAHGVRALYAEAYPNWGEGPKLYVSLKLQWNPQLNVDELLRDWYVRTVGEDAAPDLAAYYAHWEDFWTRRILESKWFTKRGQYLRFNSPSYLGDVTEAEIAESRVLLERVAQKALAPKHKARAKLLLRAFEYYEASAIAYAAQRTQEAEAIRTEADALRLLDKAERYVHMARKRSRLVLEEFPKDPVLRHGLGWDRLPLVRGENWASNLHWAVFGCAAKSDGPVRERLRQIAASPDSLLATHAKLMLMLIEKEDKPFSLAPSFEHPEGKWPDSWSPWVKWGIGSMTQSPAAAHTGTQGVLCKGMKRGGPNQTVPVTPGRYAAVAFVRVPQQPKGNATITLSMTLRNEKGTNLPNSPSTVIRAAACDWMPIATAGDVPAKVGNEEVKKVLLIIIVDGFEPGEEVHLDDVAMFRLED